MLELSTKISGDRLTASEWANHSKELENVVTKNDLPLGNEQENLYNAILRMGKKSGIIKIYKAKLINDDDNEETWFVINEPELTTIDKLEVGDSIYIDFSEGINTKYTNYTKLQIGDGDKIIVYSLDYIHAGYNHCINQFMPNFPTPLLVTKKDDYFLVNNFLYGHTNVKLDNHDDISDIISVDGTFMNDLKYTYFETRVKTNFNLTALGVYFTLVIEGSDTLIKDNLIKGEEDYNTYYIIEKYLNIGKNESRGSLYQFKFNPTISYTFEYIDSDDSNNNYTFPEILATGYDTDGVTNDKLNTKLLELDGTKDRYNKLTIKCSVTYIGETFLHDKKD